jgi:hypothetical protein
MTRDDIIRMAHQAKLFDDDQEPLPEYLERFAALVAAAEREACAKVCETTDEPLDPSAAGGVFAAAIRARGQE